jgi:alpha-tubulin suppressor-like RCC1 family protein
MGGGHTCARKGDGTLWCWGKNDYGQLGDGTVVSPKPVPVQVTALGANVVEVSAGGEHTCARKSDGTLWCWGRNNLGQIGNGTTGGANSLPVQVASLGTNVIGIVSGQDHSCARTGDGALWCWGQNYYGEVGDGTTATPRTSPVQATAVGTTAVEVAVGFYNTCIRKLDGTLWCWGANGFGQIGDGTTNSPKVAPVQVAAMGTSAVQVGTGAFTCARKADGTIWCWGFNNYGAVGDGTSVTPKPSPQQVTALGGPAVDLETGDSHACARKADGTLWCWGYNGRGEVGDGTTSPSTSPKLPVQVTVLGVDAVQVSAGDHTCARKKDGTLWCWGSNGYGQVGDGTTSNSRPTPVQTLLTCP